MDDRVLTRKITEFKGRGMATKERREHKEGQEDFGLFAFFAFLCGCSPLRNYGLPLLCGCGLPIVFFRSFVAIPL